MSKSILGLICSATLCSIVPAIAHAEELSLGAPFSSGMVLQRDRPIPIWGTGKPGDIVQVELGGTSQTTEVSGKGVWRVEHRPLSETDGLVMSVANDSSRIEIADIAVGDVFLCSGQSNMDWRMSLTSMPTAERTASVDSNIRFLTVPRTGFQVEQSGFGRPSRWSPAADGSADFSAVCLLAGREIARSEGVTIGLINASLGGSPVEAWLPYEGLKSLGGFEDQIAVLDAYRSDPVAAGEKYDAMLEDLWFNRPSPLRTRRGREGYTNLFNGMIAPLGRTQLSGAIWYQGENNANNGSSTEAYKAALETMISTWRERLDNPLPFVIVQLANFGRLSDRAGHDKWAEIREAQRLVARDDPAVELVVTIDVGERLDIHPPLKKPVAERAAKALRKLVYGEADAYRPPEAIAARREGDQAIVAIPDTGARLFAASWGRPGPFMVCADSDDAKCQFADAAFVDGGIAVEVPQEWDDVEVRYCWDAAPLCNVFDANQLPLGPFSLHAE